jgi:organic hydroperoxide reductase OsmC/OhrA
MSTTTRNSQIGTIRAQVARERPPVRQASFETTGETATYGVPTFQAEFYDMPDEGPHQEHASTFDHVLGALAACLTGTLGKALSVRGIDPEEDRLTAVAEGDIEIDGDGIMIMHRVRVTYRLVAPEDKREAAERAHRHHVGGCGVARSLRAALDISTELEMVSPS